MPALLRLELLRMLRNPAFVILGLGMPVGFYLLMTQLFLQPGWQAEGLPVQAQFMVSMAAFGGMSAVLSATGGWIAHEREIGWLRQLRTIPIPAREVITAKILAAMTLALPAMLLVGAVASLTQGVRLPGWRWMAIVALLWAGTVPFAALGVLIGYATRAETAQGVTTVAFLVLAALGGLWMPVQMLPDAMGHVARALPSNRYAELGWDVAGGHAPAPMDGTVLAAWTVGLALLATLAYRRSTARR